MNEETAAKMAAEEAAPASPATTGEFSVASVFIVTKSLVVPIEKSQKCTVPELVILFWPPSKSESFLFT